MTLPPVIVLGVDTPIGLAVVRELGDHGVEVHGIGRNRRGLGLYSRRLHKGYLRPDDPARLLEQIDGIARRSGAPFLMTVSMNDAIAVREAADAGRLPRVKPLLPALEKLALVNDKAAVCRMAERLGIRVPTTWEPDAAILEGELPDDLGFPCILKWRDPELVAPALERLGLPMLKSEFVYTARELRAALARYAPAGRFPMIQTYCAGGGLGHMFLMKNGEALLRFQHRRLHEWPPEGGTSTLCESVGLEENGALLAQSEALLREIGWDGPAMVEYRHDDRSGRSWLMEINGRFWGSLPLAYHSGAPFALGTYYALGLDRPLPPQPPYKAGRQCRYMVPEAKRLAAVAVRRRPIPDRSLSFSRSREAAAFLTGFVRPGMRYYVFKLRDPLPFLTDSAFIVGRAAGALFRRLAPGRAEGAAMPVRKGLS
jgi:predicted ATP-grasp superfamily ATP-dependent carboligase